MRMVLKHAMPFLLITGLLAGCSAPLASSSSETSGVATIDSCGQSVPVGSPPQRAIALEQGATELMLALGLEERMVGTAYRTDEIAPSYQEAYQHIPVLAAQYPSPDQVRAANPDFLYSMRSSAFSPQAAGSRKELAGLGVRAYLSRNDCEESNHSAHSANFEQIAQEIRDISAIFGVRERGEQLIATQKQALTEAEAKKPHGAEPSVVWLYSTINGAPTVAGNAGLPSEINRRTGTRNSFSDLPKQWAETSWDDIAQRNPDLIVLADLSRGKPGDSAEEKEKFLRTDETTRALGAVAANRIVSLPATELDPSVRSVNALRAFSAKLDEFSDLKEKP